MAPALTYRDLRKYTDRKSFIALATMMVIATLATLAVVYCLHEVLAYRHRSIAITSQQSALSDYYLQLLNAETGQRGYLLTGDPSYLTPYNAAVKTLPTEASTLVAEKSNPYRSQLKPIVPLTKEKLEELSTTIQAFKSEGLPAASAIVNTNQGEGYMTTLRSIINQVSIRLNKNLQAERATASTYGMYATWITSVTLILMFMLGGIVYWLFLSAIKAERELESTKEQFVALASHQLRTPVAGIKSILSVLATEDLGPLNDRQQQLLARAQDSNQRQLRIINELLEAARASTGHMTISPVRMNVLETIRAVESEQSSGTKPALKIEAPTEPIWITGDPVKLHMAISNLIDNAYKYSGPSGNVTLRVKTNPKSATPDKLTIEVADHGAGIDKADLPGIFDRYGRAHTAIVKGIEGTGLGLYLTRCVVELHHGSISVNSKKGKGSVFTVVLPTGGTK